MTPQEAYTTIDNFVRTNEVWSAVIAVIVLFWIIIGVCYLLNSKLIVQEWNECWKEK